MTKTVQNLAQYASKTRRQIPILSIARIGFVSRDYRHRFANGYRDFSYILPDLINLLDRERCDAVLFSLYSIIPRKSFVPCTAFQEYRNLKAIFLEEFLDYHCREAVRYIVYYKNQSVYKEYEFNQIFGAITEMSQQEIADFVDKELPRRVLGNCCILLCGETNGVKYSKSDKKIHDDFGLREAIPPTVNLILNPIHDRMTRFEMKLKRQFLSKKHRWVISVWNKGRYDKNGRTKDGKDPAWTVFHDGREKKVPSIQNDLGVEIGILDIR